MKIIPFANTLHNSNAWGIEIADNQAVIVDPGDPSAGSLIEWLSDTKLQLTAVLLTHEHADHCAGVNALLKHFLFPLICSPSCAAGISSGKQNLSFYIDAIDIFTIGPPIWPVDDGARVPLNKVDLADFEQKPAGENESDQLASNQYSATFYHTPGHSPGGACIFTGNHVFTGDTILNGNKSPLSFPHSSRSNYVASLMKLKKLLKPGMIIYPGHGNPFRFTSMDNLMV